MGLKDFFDDIIPNELKGNLGKIAAAGTAAILDINMLQKR